MASYSLFLFIKIKPPIVYLKTFGMYKTKQFWKLRPFDLIHNKHNKYWIKIKLLKIIAVNDVLFSEAWIASGGESYIILIRKDGF